MRSRPAESSPVASDTTAPNMCKMDVTKLINLVRVRRPIWDQKDYNYKNRDVVKLLWDEVAIELDQPLDKVRKRWKNLRDMFRNEVKKILLEAGDALPEEFISPWTHFEDMVFLKDQIVTRKTLRNLNITGVDLNDSDENEELVEISVSPVNFEEDEDEVNGVETPESFVKVEQIPHNLSEMIPTDYQRLDHFLKPQTPSRKRKREPEFVNDFYQPSLQIDDDYHFLVSFLPSMRQMPFQTKMWFRLKMQELLYSCMAMDVNAGIVLTASGSTITATVPSISGQGMAASTQTNGQ